MVHKEGEVWKEGLCKSCICQEGHITCAVLSCEEQKCQHPVNVPGVCCPTCDGCDYEENFYANGANFVHPDNPCLNCSCVNGTVFCFPIMCPAMSPCMKNALVTLNGKCCPICSMCGPHHNGSQWMESPCHNCSCNGGRVQCTVVDCPLLSCQHPWRPAGECCRRCDGCEYEGMVAKSGEIFKPNLCNECECQDGSVICQSTKCPPVDCLEPKTSPGQCCPICLIECNYDGVKYKDGAIFVPKFNPCLNCSCQNSIVRCQPMICPKLEPPCRSPVVPPGSCCPTCPNCLADDGLKYANGEKWKAPNDPCHSCICMDGIVVCSTQGTCDKDCSHGIIPVGECCSPCTDCSYEGHFVMNHMQFSPPDDPCTRCSCQEGRINCLREACPNLLCRRTELPPGSCCPVCKGCTDVGGRVIEHGRQWVHPSDVCQVCTCQEGISRCERIICKVQCRHSIKKADSCCPHCNGCQFEGKIYKNDDQVPSGDPCKKCTCYNGNVECESVACPAITCSKPILISGQCCPTCEECSIHGQTYASGEIFRLQTDPCYNCSCWMGVVKCRKLEEFCNPQCNHPIKMRDQCCPVCDGCDYEGNMYRNGEKFSPSSKDPCQYCECAHGNIQCSAHHCPELPCRNPVKSTGHCCEQCPLFCVDDGGTNIYNEGDVWTHTEDPCQVCACKHSSVQCERVSCIPVTCSHPAAPFGECCPQCVHCEFTRRLYRTGQEFAHADDPCQICKCENGTVTCDTVICDPVPCMNPKHVEGHCCPMCTLEPGCHYLGVFYEPMESFIDPLEPCTECVCIDGMVDCHQGACSDASCPNPLSGHCCNSCDGCSYGDRNYLNHVLFGDPYNPCRQCYCNSGLVSCQSEPCPQIMCHHPIMLEGECCPICKDCLYGNELFGNGEIFSDPQNPCIECHCEHPTVHCQPKTCPDVNCSHPTSDKCCKSCKGCFYENSLYEDGSHFINPQDSCQQCSCQNGNINCKARTCPQISCTHPVPKNCCEECKADCWFHGSLYTHWQVFPDPNNSCQDCICRKGNVTCKVRKCPETKCDYPFKTECCNTCTDCFYKEEHIVNGESVNKDGLDFCRACTCKNGNIKCHQKRCPVAPCSNPVIEGCCPVCHLGCLYEGIVYPFGAEFDHPNDQCSECACMKGNVQCDLKPCDSLTCQNPIKVDGQCCPQCPTYCLYEGEKHPNGSVFPHVQDPCSECKCVEGTMACTKTTCPPVHCSHPSFRNCCLECQDCRFLEKVYSEGDIFSNPQNSCEDCLCLGGEVICKRRECPSLTCPVQVSLNQCCPICVTTCRVENHTYENYETFHPKNDHCQKCTCLEGQVVCETEVCATCLHPINSSTECCPLCDGCSYNNINYNNQQRFIPLESPCEECICKNGTVTCHRLACSLPVCSQPTLPKGECCPICTGCTVSGIKFKEDQTFLNPENPCEECVCQGGYAVCKKQPCQGNCTNPVPDSCCPICDGCLFEALSYFNGENFNPDPCRTCKCKDGNIQCVSEVCAELKCPLRMRLPGQCCEVCRGCVYESTEYSNGDSWVPTSNPCLSCQCIGGSVACTEVQCVAPCAKPIPVPGRCCPLCPECAIDGKVFLPGDIFTPDNKPCDICTCESGHIMCITRQCPILVDCPQEAIRPPGIGECCPTCAGFSSSCTRDQIGHSVQPTDDPCFVCECTKDYSWTCSKEICPTFSCPEEEIVIHEKECCPKCKVCMSEPDDGSVWRHGSSWVSSVDPCITCTCEFGITKCKQASCMNIQCGPEQVARTLPGECCGSCIATDDLECLYGEIIYQSGQRWNPDPCTLCLCLTSKVTCHNQRCLPLSCPSDEILSVDPGKCCPKCIPRPATCVAFGDPHYRTFDGAYINFQGPCRYVLVADCYTQLFSVIVENSDRGLHGVSWTDRVVLVLQNTTVDLRKGPMVYVKGRALRHLPFFDDPILYIEKTGPSILVTTNIGVKVLWNGDSYVEVIVSGVFRDKTCGLCGNFNNFPEDDMKMPSGQIVTSEAKFGNSWKNRGAQPQNCEEAIDLDPCTKGGYRIRKTANTKCSVLKSSLFALCHQFVTPEPYFAACVYDMCACSENDDCLCDILSAYSQECAKAGVVLNWRSAGLCDVGCSEEEGLVFDECGPPCPRTCENRNVPIGILAAQCFKPCVPGCQCSADKVLHNGHCIHAKLCP